MVGRHIHKRTSAYAAFFVLVLALASDHAAIADDASRLAKAQQLFTLMHMDRTYGQLMTQVEAQTEQFTKQMLPEGAMSDDQKKQVTAFQSRVKALVEDSMSWKVLEPDYAKLYAATYTEQDLDGIIAFYQSSTGQAMLEKTPELLKASSAIATSRMEIVQPKLRQMLEDFQAQVKVGESSKK